MFEVRNENEIRAFQSPPHRAIELYIARRRCDGKRGVETARLTWEKVPEGSPGERACLIGDVEAQRLMDDLWACGLRPTEGAGSAGQLTATQVHLTDMREIAMLAVNQALTSHVVLSDTRRKRVKPGECIVLPPHGS